MEPVDLARAAAIATGLGVGSLIARLSVTLPERDSSARPSHLRIALLAFAAAALAAWSVAVQPGWSGVLGATLAWQLLILAVLDAEHFWLPRLLTLPLIGTGLLASAVGGMEPLGSAAIGAAAGFLALSAVALAYRLWRGREGLGGGDAYLLAGGGAWAGWMALPTILVWAAGAGLTAVALLALSGRRVGPRQQLPFGVVLALGIWLAWLYGPLARPGL